MVSTGAAAADADAAPGRRFRRLRWPSATTRSFQALDLVPPTSKQAWTTYSQAYLPIFMQLSACLPHQEARANRRPRCICTAPCTSENGSARAQILARPRSPHPLSLRRTSFSVPLQVRPHFIKSVRTRFSLIFSFLAPVITAIVYARRQLHRRLSRRGVRQTRDPAA